MKKTLFCCLWFILAGWLCGCALSQPVDEIPSDVVVISDMGLDSIKEATTESIIKRTEQVGDTTITICATVAPVEMEQLYSVTLEPDSAAWESMARELLPDWIPEIESAVESGSYNICVWANDRIRLLYSLEERAGYLSYIDCDKDLNNSNLENGGNEYIPHYITSLIPEGMEVTAEEAAKTVCELFNSNSYFDFEPWNVVAQYDSQKSKGCYHFILQPQFDGTAVYRGTDVGGISSFYSEDGIFACQGPIFLKERERTEISAFFPLESAVEQLIANCPAYAYGEQVICQRVCLGYIENEENDTITLSPAWIFECQDTCDTDDLTDAYTYYYNCGFYLETGEFWLN